MTRSGPVRLLLVEDNPQDLEMTMRALRKAALADNIQVARDGAEALDYLFCEGAFAGREIADIPKLVLLDLKLPKIDGIEVLRRLKEDPRTRMIPVVVLTSSMLRADVEAAFRGGANSLVVKPVGFADHSLALRTIGTYWLGLNLAPPS